MNNLDFKRQIEEGIPISLPENKIYDQDVNHAPVRADLLNREEKKLALANALRYFPKELHKDLAPEFANELKRYGRIYMYRYRPEYCIVSGSIEDYPHKSKEAAAIMLMLHNNLDHSVAQHPHELITYGGNGSVFQNWAQYRLTMKYLSQMTDEQTLVLYSGHPMGLFPSHKSAPRAVITNGMVIPNYSSKDLYEKFNAMGVSQYGQMTAGSFMYIGPQGIVHGTTITLINAARLHSRMQNLSETNIQGKLFVSSGLGGMSGAQTKAAKIAGLIGVVAEVNKKVIDKRFAQGWVDEIYNDLNSLIKRIKELKTNKTPLSIAYHGNVVDLWEALASDKIEVELGSDQTSLHNPWSGGYYPCEISFEEANIMISSNPEKFRSLVKSSLVREAAAIKSLSKEGMYFFDYGNAFLLESSRAGADVTDTSGKFIYPSYVQDIMGPLFFDYGFGPFRWICTSGKPSDLAESDKIALEVLKSIEATDEIKSQLEDNIHWIEEAGKNNLVVGSQARILYADSEGRIKIALALNSAIADKRISAPIVLGRDHHDVSGTDSPYRETSNIYDGSSFTADMAVQNVIGDSFRGASWVSIHNGGGVGWGEVINGGFGMLIDGSKESENKIKNMLLWDVNNGIARRSWARNAGAISAIKREMKRNPTLVVTIPHLADNDIIDSAL